MRTERLGRKVLLAGPAGARGGTAHDVGDPVDRLAALVVVIVPGDHELDSVPLEQRDERPAHVQVGTLVSGRVGRVVDQDDPPSLCRRGKRVLEPRPLVGVIDQIRVESHQEHVTEVVRPPSAMHTEGLDLTVGVPLLDVVVPENREQPCLVEHLGERVEDRAVEPGGVPGRVDVVSEDDQAVEGLDGVEPRYGPPGRVDA